MPTYLYFCSCGYKEDIVHSIKVDSVKKECPRCRMIMKKGFAPSGIFMLKGPGWSKKTRRLNKEMVKRNEDAEKRMKKERDPIKSDYLAIEGSEFAEIAESQGCKVVSEGEAKEMLDDQRSQGTVKPLKKGKK